MALRGPALLIKTLIKSILLLPLGGPEV
jgi:hypothetical protein